MTTDPEGSVGERVYVSHDAAPGNEAVLEELDVDRERIEVLLEDPTIRTLTWTFGATDDPDNPNDLLQFRDDEWAVLPRGAWTRLGVRREVYPDD